MKTKKLLLALPMVAIMASCSAKIVVYKDIFKDARGLDDETKEEARAGLRNYAYTGTKTIHVYEGDQQIAEVVQNITASFSKEEIEGDKVWFATYAIDGVDKLDITVDENDQLVWVTCPDQSLNAGTVFNRFGELVFSWRGNIETGDFDTAPYDYDTNLLNAVSPKCRILDGKKSSAPNFSIQMTGGQASFKNGKITTTITSYAVTYASYRIQNYSLAYRYTFEGVNFSVSYVLEGSFDYNAR